MMKKTFSLILLMGLMVPAFAESITIDTFRHAGPFPVVKPFQIDSLNVESKAFDEKSFLDMEINREALVGTVKADALPQSISELSLNLLSCSIENTMFTKAELCLEGLKDYKLLLDGKPASGKVKLSPATHVIDIKYLSRKGTKDEVKLSIKTDGEIKVRTDGKHLYGLKDVLLGTRLTGISVSADGKYLIKSYKTTFEGGKSSNFATVVETESGRIISRTEEKIDWIPGSSQYYCSRKSAQGNQLIAFDPESGSEKCISASIPEGRFQFSPDRKKLIYFLEEKGPKEKEGIYQIITPDDRQPGWRDRSYCSIYDIETGVMQRLSYGYHNSFVSDVSKDGKYALVLSSEERLTERPTTLSTLYKLDLKTLETEILVEKDGFMNRAAFSPDASQILLSGSPEAFGGIGKNVKDGQTPSMYDNQLYIMDLSSKKIRPMTRQFNPCVEQAEWSQFDGKIYFSAQDLDYVKFFKMDPSNGKITELEAGEDVVTNFSLAESAPVAALYGEGAMNSQRLHLVDLASGKERIIEDLSATILKDVELGECHAWNFKNSKGETVYGRYYLPPHFDPSKKYPMIVNYYGGCSPTSRDFETRYPQNAYAALGYVVYIVAGPSGATGFGQEWSARHVNTAGNGPAQDIIEGTKQFCKEHSFVNEKKLGCIGASYGGFMSEYIPSITDMFACSVSHAGISDHTSYWGFGYWGYSYSEVSMANSYPWSERELYVGQSPLYNADKIHTPLLLVHGDSDTNVPFNESVQLFTALKLLGRETALVAVKGQNHWILDYNKRLEWQNTIWAWFAKWLQDDDSWWNELYSPKSL